MPTEDFTRYIETDPNSDITVTSEKCDVSSMSRSIEAHVKYDKGLNYFKNFKHLVQGYVTSADNGGLGGVWAVTNGSDTYSEMDTNNEGILVFFYRTAGGLYYLYLKDFTNDNEDFYVYSTGTIYYLTIERAGTTATCKIYSNASRTTLLDTLTITCGSGAYRYIIPCCSWETGGTTYITYYVENLDLQEGYEDFTTYTEVDEETDITVTATRCTVDTMRRPVTSYVRKDKGAGYFGDFEHLITALISSIDDAWLRATFWAITNGASTAADMGTGDDGLACFFYRDGATYTINLFDYTNDNSDTYSYSLSTIYYFTIERSGTTATVKIYSDASRSTLLDTLTITCGATAYRYVFAVASHENDGDYYFTFYSEHLDLQEDQYENFLTYIEVDPNNHIAVPDKFRTTFDFYCNEDAYLYMDKGVDTIQNFNHLINVNVLEDGSGDHAYGYVWALTNLINDMKGIKDASGDYLGVEVAYRPSPVTRQLRLYECDAGSTYSDSSDNYPPPHQHYLTIEKNGTSLTCKIYTDVGRTTLDDTLTLTLQNDYSFRYIFACNTWNSGLNVHLNVEIDYLELQSLIDSYSEANQDSSRILQNLHPSANAYNSAAYQSFQNVGSAKKITLVKLYLMKTGSPTAIANVVLYAHSGTYGTSSVPTGSPLAISDDFDTSTLTGSYVLYEIKFSGTQQYEMLPNEYYCIAFQMTSGTVNASNYPRTGADNSSPAHGGNDGLYKNSAWSIGSMDLCFYVYGRAVASFKDDFENGFTPWTGQTGTPTIETDNPHHGSQNMESVVLANGSEESTYKTIPEAQAYYAQAQFKFSRVITTAGRTIQFLTLLNGGQDIALVSTYNDGGTLKVRLSYYGGGSWNNVSTAFTWAADTDYCVKIFCYVHATEGNMIIWINGNQVLSVSGVDNNDRGNIDRIEVGARAGSGALGASTEVYTDCVDVFTSEMECCVVTEATYTKSFDADSYLQATFTKPFDVDAWLVTRLTKPFDADARLVDRLTKPFDADAFLKATFTKGFDVDARLVDRFIKEFDVDAILTSSFYIINVSTDIARVVRSGANTIELRVDFHDEEDLLDSDYTVQFYVREPDDSTTHGPYAGTVTKEGSKEYNATYDLDPADGWALDDYDIKVAVNKW